MKHLVIGGRGQLGSAMCEELSARQIDFVSTTRRERPGKNEIHLDLRNPMPKLPAADRVYLVASFTGLHPCEGSREAYVVNVDAPIAIAKQAKLGSVIFISSEIVEWNNSLAYTHHKATVESFMRIMDGIIIRLPKLTSLNILEVAAFVIDVGTAGIPGVYRWHL